MHVLSLALPGWEQALLALAAVACAMRSAVFGGIAAVAPLSFGLIFTAVGAAHHLGGRGDAGRLCAGLGVALFGVVPKAADASRAARKARASEAEGRGCWWGTTSFHYTAAAGFTLVFLWAQTLPRV